MAERTPLEMLEEVKDALDFQLVVMKATDASNISLSKDHALICLIAVEKMILKYTEKSEGERPMFENTRNILHHLKRQIHDKAVYPHNAGIDAYITLKAFDAILQNYLNGLK